jgi:hypothetical protein
MQSVHITTNVVGNVGENGPSSIIRMQFQTKSFQNIANNDCNYFQVLLKMKMMLQNL